MKFELREEWNGVFCFYLKNTDYGTIRFLCPDNVISTTPYSYETEGEALDVLDRYVLSLARKVKLKHNAILQDLMVKSRHGDKNAATDIIKQMTNQNIELKELGYRLTDTGSLIKISKTWQKNKHKKVLKSLGKIQDIVSRDTMNQFLQEIS